MIYFAVWAMLAMLRSSADPMTFCDDAEHARLCAVAEDTVAATDGARALPFDGPAAQSASIVALLSVAYHESGLREDVQDCTVRGDKGRSISLYQLHVGPARHGHTADEICSDNLLATRLALRYLARTARRGSVYGMFSGYAGAPGKAALEITAIYRTQAMRWSIAQCPRRSELRVAMSAEGCDGP